MRVDEQSFFSDQGSYVLLYSVSRLLLDGMTGNEKFTSSHPLEANDSHLQPMTN